MALMILGPFFVLFAALLIFSLWFHRHARKRYAASLRWLESPATIISTQVIKHKSSDGDGASFTNYNPQINYSYRAGGAERQSDKIGLSVLPTFITRADCDAWLESYVAGTVVSAWYDPANPEDSALVLEKPSAIASLVMVSIGLIGTVVIGRELALELLK